MASAFKHLHCSEADSRRSRWEHISLSFVHSTYKQVLIMLAPSKVNAVTSLVITVTSLTDFKGTDFNSDV